MNGPGGGRVFDIREIRGTVTGLALVAVLLLVAVSIDFGIPGQALLQSLRFHIAGLLLLAILVLAAAGARRRLLPFGLVLITSCIQGGDILLHMHAQRGQLAAGPLSGQFTVLSFNVLASNTENGARIADFVATSGADVAVIMEAAPLFPHMEKLAAVYPSRVGCTSGDACDLLVLSKTPLSGVQVRSLSSYWHNRLVTATTEIGGRRVDIVAAHMVKPYFDMASVGETEQLDGILRSLDGPLLLTGDFNAAPWSNTIVSLAESAKLIPGPSHPATWPVELGAFGVPIDNMFTRASLLITDIASTEPMGSNHRGLLAHLAFTTPGP